MSKVLADNAYTFRTDTQDDYLERVIAEAAPETNFIVISDEDKLTKELGLVVLVKNYITALALIYPDVKVGPEPLSAWFEKSIEQSKQQTNPDGFVVMSIHGDREGVEKARETVQQDIRHIDNILKGRIIQVTVETF